MPVLRRHKYVMLALGIYWPLIFWLTHIPVPDIARRSGMSDKTMHALAYLTLTFLLCLAISPYKKMRWIRPSFWAILTVMVGYAAMDEWLQGRVGRSMDRMDFLADVLGILLGLGILTILNFWPALLTVSAIFIFTVNNLSNATLLFPEYHLNTVFHFTAYAALTLIWIQYNCRRRPPDDHSAGRLSIWTLPPLGILFFVKTAGLFFQKGIWWVDMVTAIFAISAAALSSFFVLRIKNNKPS